MVNIASSVLLLSKVINEGRTFVESVGVLQVTVALGPQVGCKVADPRYLLTLTVKLVAAEPIGTTQGLTSPPQGRPVTGFQSWLAHPGITLILRLVI